MKLTLAAVAVVACTLVALVSSQAPQWFDCPIFTHSFYNASAANETLSSRQLEALLHDAAQQGIRTAARMVSREHPEHQYFGPVGPSLQSRHLYALRSEGSQNVPTTAECAYVPMPLGQGEAHKVHVFVKRLSPARNFKREARKQVWLLQGGPVCVFCF